MAASTAGRPVRFGAAGFVVVLMPDMHGAASLLRRAGAWLVLDPKAIGGCASVTDPDANRD